MITFEQRKELKRSADQGSYTIESSTRKHHRSIGDLLSDHEALISFEHSPELGHGTYGEAKEVGEHVVCKITGCGSHLLGDVHSIWRAENIEPRLLRFLWEQLVETKVTPHIIAPLGLSHAIVEGTTSRQQKEDNETTQSLVQFMEKATAGTVRGYFTRLSVINFDLVFRVILFQVCYTLEAIYMRFPRFRHNDLKDDNVLLHKSASTGYTKYTIHGVTFTLPNVGVTALISDFDFACITGHVFDNYKVTEQEWETPSYNMNTRIDHCSDLSCFVSYVRNQFGDKISNSTRKTLQKVFGSSKKNNGYRCTVEESGVLPTTRDVLLDTTLFEDFAYEEEGGGRGGGDHFISNPNSVIPPPFLVPPHVNQKELRHAPVFLPRSSQVLDPQVLPSFQMFRNWPPAHSFIDKDEPTMFSEMASNRLIGVMQCIYSIKANPKKDVAGFGFPEKHREAFFDTVEQTAASFILDYFVPLRWWPAVYTCAFIDTIEEMDLAVSNQVCWHFMQWCEFWEDKGEASYTQMQLLHFAVQWGWVRE